jgi:hypothetical protein
MGRAAKWGRKSRGGKGLGGWDFLEQGEERDGFGFTGEGSRGGAEARRERETELRKEGCQTVV